MHSNSRKPWAPKPEHQNYNKNYNKYNLNDSNKVNSKTRNSKPNFMSAMEKTRNQIYNLKLTENGAVGYATSGSELLDLNFAVSSLRGNDTRTREMFRKAFKENPILAMRWLFYARDIREGIGERNLFKVCMKDLAENGMKEQVNRLIPLVAEYGRWDDILPLLNTPGCQRTVLSTISAQWFADVKNMKDNRAISLMAKWLPSEQRSNHEQKTYATMIMKYLKLSPRTYRQTLSSLRKYLDVTERKMSSNNWQSIDYEKVASKANLIYNKAFLKHDEDRRSSYLNALKTGEAKINSSTAYPYEIVHKYMAQSGYYRSVNYTDIALEKMWESLPDLVQGNDTTMVVADGSGSMSSFCNNTKVRLLEVASSLAIYFAERCNGAFKNKYITFSETPKIVSLEADTLAKKINCALKNSECANTNIEAVFDLILKTAIAHHMTQDEIPANILILSDMEFDSCAVQNGSRYRNYVQKTLFETIADKYKRYGYKLPKLIFWNLGSRTETIPFTSNEMGVTLVSGFSPNVCKAVMSNRTDPYEALVDTLMDSRYDPVEKAILNA